MQQQKKRSAKTPTKKPNTKPIKNPTKASAKKPVKKPMKPPQQKPADRTRDRPVPPPAQRREPDRDEKKRKRKRAILYVIIFALIMVIIFLILRMCNKDGERKTDYEDTVSISYEPNADIQVDDTKLNLAILPDYVVTKNKPEMLIPYPEQNAYDIDLTFCDPDTDEILYQSKLIKPGSVISVPAYNFVDDGEHEYRVEVRAFDRTTHEIVETAVAMTANITKK